MRSTDAAPARTAVAADCAAPEDGDAASGHGDPGRFLEERLPGGHVTLAGDPEPGRPAQSHADNHGVETGSQRRGIGDGGAGLEFDGAKAEHMSQIGAQQSRGQAKGRNERHHSTQAPALVKDRDAIAALPEPRGCAQARGSRADDGNLEAVGRLGGRGGAGDPPGPGHYRRLHRRDLDRPVEGPPRAGLDTETVRTHGAADAAERIGAPDHGGRTVKIRILSAPGGHDEVGRRAIGRAGRLAGFVLAGDAPVQFGPKLGVGEKAKAGIHSRRPGKGRRPILPQPPCAPSLGIAKACAYLGRGRLGD